MLRRRDKSTCNACNLFVLFSTLKHYRRLLPLRIRKNFYCAIISRYDDVLLLFSERCNFDVVHWAFPLKWKVTFPQHDRLILCQFNRSNAPSFCAEHHYWEALTRGLRLNVKASYVGVQLSLVEQFAFTVYCSNLILYCNDGDWPDLWNRGDHHMIDNVVCQVKILIKNLRLSRDIAV